jgi:hypothetical protein
MAVETYLEEELKDLVTDAEKTDEWKKKVEELGLTGQQELVGDPEKSPVPFPRMTGEMQNVYKTLCPQYGGVENYRGSTIPLRVLSMLALAKQENYFQTLEIWSNDSSPDPILVGYVGNRYDGLPFIIARWGDELRSFVELKQQAAKILIEDKKTEYKHRLASVEHDVTSFLNGNFVSW